MAGESKKDTVVDRMVIMEADGKCTHSKSGGDAFALDGCKRTQKKWLLKLFGSNKKTNFKPDEGVILN